MSIDPELQQQLVTFLGRLEDLSNEHGIELDEADQAQILSQAYEHGFTDDAVDNAFTEVAGLNAFDEDHQNLDQLEHSAGMLADHVNHDLDRFEAEQGRPLLGRERQAIVTAALRHTERHPNELLPAGFAEQALEAHYTQNPNERPDLTSNAGRARFMAERFHEQEQPEDRDLTVEVNPTGSTAEKLNAFRDRAEYMAAKLRGEEFEDAEDDDAEAPDTEPESLEEAA